MVNNYLDLAKQHFTCGIEHLASGDTNRLRYAALDMRLAIEAIIYKKCDMLLEDKENLPKNVWQPRQLILFIEQLHPELNSDVTVSFAFAQSGDAPPPSDESLFHKLFDSKKIDPNNLRTLHNNLGNYLHVTQASPAEMKDKLETIKDTIQKWLYSAHVVMSSNLETDRLCKSCGKRLIYSRDWFQQGGIIRCLSENCGAEYQAEPDLETLTYKSAIEVPCVHCSEKIDVTPKQLLSLVNNLNKKEPVLKLKCKCSKTTDAYLAIGYQKR
ncbi:hypothetical protein [Shewanella xiamenensis]|uniref:hypothetical protein n=1 Tax=Shewanella xiamenensis TaxID=332186 RepID=UPI0024A65861|nr:hypothetical protein [Shewanella xiamenensis]MDI5875034.1 hypothetical protein [Shewanella xiamenensis]